jgi:hypothetical protein
LIGGVVFSVSLTEKENAMKEAGSGSMKRYMVGAVALMGASVVMAGSGDLDEAV